MTVLNKLSLNIHSLLKNVDVLICVLIILKNVDILNLSVMGAKNISMEKHVVTPLCSIQQEQNWWNWDILQ